MKAKKEEGFTGIDISIAVIIIIIFISIIANMTYQFNTSSKEIQRRAEAIEIAITEIEKIKNDGFEKYQGMDKTTTVDNEGNGLENQTIEGKEGFYKTIVIEDYTDIEGNESKIKDLVKKITVKISYNYRAKEQNVEFSTILSKEI